MSSRSNHWFWLAVAGCLFFAQAALAADGQAGRLVSVQWLQRNLGADDVLLLDASVAPLYAGKHIPGAISVDLFTYGVQEIPVAEMERRLQSWGVGAGRRIVVYDQGGTFMATRLFFDLYYYGFPADRLFLLDGGLAKWEESGGNVTKDTTPLPAPGSFRITKFNDDVRVKLGEFLTASGDPAKNALVEALEPSYHFGETQFFDRGGHVPNGIMAPTADFFNADKTFKSTEEIRTMMTYLGVRPEQQIHTYCGGGVAASVPFFALKFMLDYPKVKLYKESELEWLRDDRELPFWTYDAPYLRRETSWLNAWNARMLRTFGVARLNIVDVRTAEAFSQGHVPYALNIPAEVFRSHTANPDRLAATLGTAGVNTAFETVIVSDGGVNERSALAFLMLERLGQRKVSILMGSVDDWALQGLPLTKDPTAVGPKKGPQDLSIVPVVYSADARPGVVTARGDVTKGQYPTIYLASGKSVPGTQNGRVIHVPYTELLNADGTPKAAKDIWKTLTKAGVPRYAEIICFSDDPGEAAVNYYVLRLMGYPDVKVQTL